MIINVYILFYCISIIISAVFIGNYINPKFYDKISEKIVCIILSIGFSTIIHTIIMGLAVYDVSILIIYILHILAVLYIYRVFK